MAYSQAVVQSAAKEKVDPWLVEAIIFNESRWRSGSFRQESNGTCSVGLGQINVPDCNPDRIARLKEPETNIGQVARFLVRIQELCPRVWPKKKCVHGGWVGLYNSGDPTYAKRVLLRTKEHARHRESHLRAVRPGLHASGVHR